MRRMEQPETRYARRGDVHIAYQVVGEGPIDLVVVPAAVSHVELQWEDLPSAAGRWRLASFSRLIVFDKQGTGLSDRTAGPLALEHHLDDITCVLDAVGSERACLLGQIDGGILAAIFAATYPERTRALVTQGTPARLLQADDYPWGIDTNLWEMTQRVADDGFALDQLMLLAAPERSSDPEFMAWSRRFWRAGIGPGGLLAFMRAVADTDIRPVLPTIRVPTLVMHLAQDALVPVESARYMASHIPGARLVVVPGADTAKFQEDEVIDEVETFLTGVRPQPRVDRVLATVLFADIVGSTQRLSELGDRRWRDRLDRMRSVVRRELERFRGTFVKDTGDGYLATFDGPARAIRCAQAVRDSLLALEIETRTGLHTGEIELRGGDVAGIAVHIGQRVSAMAEPGEVLVSRTVTDLVAGSGLEFEDRGEHEMKGVPGRWQVYAVKP